MKRIVFLTIWFSYVSILAQKASSEKIIEELRAKVEHSEKGEKLVWLDSLANFSYFEIGLEDDSILKETISFALSLDSINKATWHTVNLINFYNNAKGNPKEGNRIFLDFLEASKRATDYRTLAKFYIEGGDSYYFMEDHLAAVKNLEIAEANAVKANETKFVGLAKLYKAASLSFLGDFSESSQALQEAAKIFQKTKDTFNNISARNSLSVLYSQNAFYEEAAAERNEAILLAKKIKSYDHLTSFYYNAATDARAQGNNELRIKNLKLSLDAVEKSSNPSYYLGNMLAAAVIAYSETDSIAIAEEYLIKIENNIEENADGRNREPYTDALMHLAFAKKDYEKALLYGEEHLAIEKGGTHFEEIRESEEFLAKAYEAAGNKEKALIHYKNYTKIKDSIFSVQKVKALSYYQTLYETEKRDLKIKAQESDIALLDARNKVKNQWLLFGGLGLLSVFSLVVLSRSRNEAKRRQKLTENFSRNLISAQEEERIRVARELHDSVGQKLMLLTRQTKSIGNEKMETLAVDTLQELRSISRGLHPAALERLGITAALVAMINEIDASTPILFTNDVDNIDDLLSKDSSLHVYRIFQEVLNNMVKHAEAKTASVSIKRNNDEIRMIIMDNGKGFEFSEKLKHSSSLGMKTLLERAKIIKSTLEIKSKYNQGTAIELLIPVFNV